MEELFLIIRACLLKHTTLISSTTYEYEDEAALVETGMTPVIHYDPAGRIIKTDFPNGTFSKVEFNAWFYRGYDVNDTVRDVDCKWYTDRGAPDPL